MTGDSTQVKRTREIEEATNLYFIHPISRVLVSVLARFGIHPNLVSITGMVFGGLAAWAYYYHSRWEMALAGFLLMIGWHVMDGADGQLARLTGKTSEIGRALDGLCDHLTFALVYISLGWAAAPVFGPVAWWLMVLAGVSHVVQASTYEYQRQMYDYWVFGKESARPVMPAEFRQEMEGKKGFSRFFGGTLLTYLSIQHRVAGADTRLVAQLECMKEAGEEVKVTEVYRSANLSAVKTWSILCSNYRTIAVFIACLAKNPLYFFLFELGFLNVALVALRMMQARRNQQLLSRLANCTDAAPRDALAAA
jgi:phosphatidylglycerophosphate synthase